MIAFFAMILIPGAVLLRAAWLDRYDGRPDYVVPWIVFAAVVGAAWTLPLPSSSRSGRIAAAIAIPAWVWPWIALVGVLVFRR